MLVWGNLFGEPWERIPITMGKIKLNPRRSCCQERAKSTMKTERLFHALWQWGTNTEVLQCLAAVFNPLGSKAAGDGKEIQKSHTETQMPVLYCVHVSNRCLSEMLKYPFNTDSLQERACLQNPFTDEHFFFVIFKVLQAFLTFVPSESYSCTPNLHLKASSPLRAFLRNGNLSPHPEVWFLNGVQADDFSWMGVF